MQEGLCLLLLKPIGVPLEKSLKLHMKQQFKRYSQVMSVVVLPQQQFYSLLY
ncbi:hypothetical protein D3C77_788730 [compost metagenome]